MIGLATYRRDVAAGARAMVPWLVGVTPFGLVIGVSASRAHVPTLAGWLTGPAIYAGSAQMAAIDMLNAGAAPTAIVVTVLIINVRLILYGAAMAPHWRATPLWWRLLAGYLLVDPSFSVGVERYGQDNDRQWPPAERGRAHAHYLGGALLLWVTWLAAIGVGSAVGAQLPEWLHLEFLIPLYLIGQLAPNLARATTRRAAVTAGAVAMLALAAPMHLGIALGIVAGIASGLVRRAHAPSPAEEATR